MHPDKLGDAFDHWKGSMLHRLKIGKVLKNITVVSMSTDDWNPGQKSFYSRLLQINEEKILHFDKKFNGGKKSGNRESYFKDIKHTGDLFLDPDTGISITNSTIDSQHVTSEDIKVLLKDEKIKKDNRVIMIYQHAGRESTTERLKDIIKYVSKDIVGLSSTAYNCGQVAMLFFSLDKGRIKEIKTFLMNELSEGLNKRVITLH